MRWPTLRNAWYLIAAKPAHHYIPLQIVFAFVHNQRNSAPSPATPEQRRADAAYRRIGLARRRIEPLGYLNKGGVMFGSAR